jgi:hypothetical protein
MGLIVTLQIRRLKMSAQATASPIFRVFGKIRSATAQTIQIHPTFARKEIPCIE